MPTGSVTYPTALTRSSKATSFYWMQNVKLSRLGLNRNCLPPSGSRIVHARVDAWLAPCLYGTPWARVVQKFSPEYDMLSELQLRLQQSLALIKQPANQA